MDRPFSKKAKLQDFPPIPACEVTAFHLVHATEPATLNAEIDAGGDDFEAEFFHQHFGQDEEIKGYENPEIDIWLHSNSYVAWVDARFDAKARKADDLDSIFANSFKTGYCKSREDFVAAVAQQPKLELTGTGGDNTVHSAALADGGELVVKAFRLASAPDHVKALHARLEPLLLFYVDGANYIEADDPKWELLLAVQRINGADVVVGFSTAYHFYAYPDRARLRFSQVLVLPPFQGRGVGGHLLRAAYAIARRSGYLDLTVEDPTPNLQRLREKLELQDLMAAPWVVEAAKERLAAAEAAVSAAAAASGGSASSSEDDVAAAATAAAPKLLPPPELLDRIQQDLKIHRKQAKCVWEAVLFCLAPETLTPCLVFMVRGRLEAAAFATVAREAEAKKIVDVPPPGGAPSDGSTFFMYLPRRGAAANGADAAAAAADGAGPSSSAAAATGAEASGTALSIGGRGSRVDAVSVEDKEAAMGALLTERFSQLTALKVAMGPKPQWTGVAGSS